jgi:spectinomycin phosphotransferase
VETPPPDAFAEHDLVGALAEHWRLPDLGVRYLPKGMGSYQWRADVAGRPAYVVKVDDLDQKPWLGDRRPETFARLSAGYGAARDLEHDAGLRFVVGPLATAGGAVTVRLTDQHSMAVFPFVAGRAGRWGDPLTPARRVDMLALLAELHAATPPVHRDVLRPPLALAERPQLDAALDALGSPWRGGPLADAARDALAAHADAVRARLARLDELAAALAASAEDRRVVTHGEPHPGNLIETTAGLCLIDWDTVAAALPERDLWMLDDGSAGSFTAYERATGRAVDPAAVELHRLAWTLSDIASFATMFRAPHGRTTWLEAKWAGFLGLLAGAPSAPYG